MERRARPLPPRPGRHRAAVHEPDRDRYGDLVCAFNRALRRLLRTPAPDLRALSLKIDLPSTRDRRESTGGEACMASSSRTPAASRRDAIGQFSIAIDGIGGDNSRAPAHVGNRDQYLRFIILRIVSRAARLWELENHADGIVAAWHRLLPRLGRNLSWLHEEIPITRSAGRWAGRRRWIYKVDGLRPRISLTRLLLAPPRLKSSDAVQPERVIRGGGRKQRRPRQVIRKGFARPSFPRSPMMSIAAQLNQRPRSPRFSMLMAT